jgi:hypothetical protein
LRDFLVSKNLKTPFNCLEEPVKLNPVTISRLLLLACFLFLMPGDLPASQIAPPDTHAFVEKYCFDCHDADGKKGGLNLEELKPSADPRTFAEWVKLDDRVMRGEMPPKKKKRPAPADLQAFTNSLSAWLLSTDEARVAREGRATKRRLNRYEYEETLRDLLSLPYLEVKAFLPEDSESHGFNKIGDSLDVSHVQMARYLAAAEFALRQAMAPQPERPETRTNRYYTWEQREFFGKINLGGPLNRRTFPLIGLDLQTNIMAEAQPHRPEKLFEDNKEQSSMAVVVSTYEPTEIRFGGFRAPVSGRYHLKFSAYSIWMGPKYKKVSTAKRSEPVTIYAERPPRSLRKLGSFDVEPEPTVHEIDAWLLAGETIRPDAARLFRSRPPDFINPLGTPEGMPGVAFGWLEVQGPEIEQWPPAGHRLLFGDLPMKAAASKSGVASKRKRWHPSSGVEVTSSDPEHDTENLIRGFLRRAYQRPVEESDVQLFAGIARRALKGGFSFTDAMIAAYTGVLCSPKFLYFQEAPGRLDDWAIAERLSYFLWNSPPDDELLRLANSGELHQPEVLGKETDRLLNDPRSARFVDAFLDYWLDLRLISGTAPDEELYPDYQLDDLLAESMIAETRDFFTELVRHDLGVTNFVNSDFAMLNERLASLYGIKAVQGVAIRRVALPKDSPRGGFLTQASVLKVTSNGTTTSPVKRGVWIMTRLLGQPPHPPPPNLPAIEPDIRGATTVREQLAKHRNQASCNACHRNIDPPGFALESFDVMGAWRDHYRATGQANPVKGVGHNGLKYHFSWGPKVDASGELPDGEHFSDIREFKVCLLKDEEQLARNFVQQLVIYATGAPIGYSDRPRIERMLAKTREKGYGVRSIIHELVQSDLFLNK